MSLLCASVAALALVERPLPTSRPAVAVSTTPPQLASRRELLTAAVTATGGLAALSALPTAALAESTLTTRQQAYTRYVPRIERSRDFWAGGLRKMVQAKDWEAIKKELAKKGAIDKAFGPMELWASSWSSKTVSDKTLAMNEAVAELKEAAQALEIAANGKEGGGGFFGFGGPKVMDESKRGALAAAGYKKGVGAFNKYIEIGNDGIGLNFAAIDTID